jgi:hypothetical protein
MNIVVLGAHKPAKSCITRAHEEIEMARQVQQIVHQIDALLPIEKHLPLATSIYDDTASTYTIYKLKGVVRIPDRQSKNLSHRTGFWQTIPENDIEIEQMAGLHALCLANDTYLWAIEALRAAHIAIVYCKGSFANTAQLHRSSFYKHLKSVFVGVHSHCQIIICDESQTLFASKGSNLERYIQSLLGDHSHVQYIKSIADVQMPIEHAIHAYLRSQIREKTIAVENELFPPETRIEPLSIEQHNAIAQRLHAAEDYLFNKMQSCKFDWKDSPVGLLSLLMGDIPKWSANRISPSLQQARDLHQFCKREHAIYNSGVLAIDRNQCHALYEMLMQSFGYAPDIIDKSSLITPEQTAPSWSEDTLRDMFDHDESASSSTDLCDDDVPDDELPF